MDAETAEITRPGGTGMTWIELARHIGAMTLGQRRRLVYFCASETGHIDTPGLILA